MKYTEGHANATQMSRKRRRGFVWELLESPTQKTQKYEKRLQNILLTEASLVVWGESVPPVTWSDWIETCVLVRRISVGILQN